MIWNKQKPSSDSEASSVEFKQVILNQPIIFMSKYWLLSAGNELTIICLFVGSEGRWN